MRDRQRADVFGQPDRWRHAWRALLAWVVARARTSTREVIDYPPPQPLPALWSRADLGCAFMCGYPLLAGARRRRSSWRRPCRSPPAYRGEPVYWTNIVVRTDGADAHARRRLRPSASRTRRPTRSPATRRCARSLRRMRSARRAAVRDDGRPAGHAAPRRRGGPRRRRRRGPARQLRLRPPAHARAAARSRRCASIATTPPTPIPPLVGAAEHRARDAAALRDALLAVASTHRSSRAARDDAAAARLRRRVDRATYAVLRRRARPPTRWAILASR